MVPTASRCSATWTGYRWQVAAALLIYLCGLAWLSLMGLAATGRPLGLLFLLFIAFPETGLFSLAASAPLFLRSVSLLEQAGQPAEMIVWLLAGHWCGALALTYAAAALA